MKLIRFVLTAIVLIPVGFIPVARAASLTPPPDERFKADLLVVIAHPDDDTEVGAYLARAVFDLHKRVAVVFGTRGNTGGNAEGQEQSDALGDIREIEAHRALGHFGITSVFFLGGIDTPGQDVLRSLEHWNHADQLGRLVRIVRLTRPTVIATWLPVVLAGEDHGDHQAAGVLATEAFDYAGDPTFLGEQVSTPPNRFDISNLTEGLRAWQPEKLYYFSDTAHPEVLDGKGPSYSATDVSPSRKVAYARLAAEECAYYLTQGDTGQMARKALEKNDLHYFEQPVRFVFGKSLVESTPTADLFQGVVESGIPYHRAPGFKQETFAAPTALLGGAWQFYRAFRPAHGVSQFADISKQPELMANFESPLTVPVVVENPTEQVLHVQLSVDIPKGWVFWRQAPRDIEVAPHSSETFSFETRTPVEKTPGSGEIAVHVRTSEREIGNIQLRVELDRSGMPQ